MKISLPPFLTSGIKTIFSGPWKRTMILDHDDDDNFAPFLAPSLHMNVQHYVQTYFNTAKLSDLPHHALNERHLVDIVGVNKDISGPLHESLTASVKDEDTLKMYMLVLERMASNRPIQPEDIDVTCFAQFPDSQVVADAIQDALRDMRDTQDGSPSPSDHPTPASSNILSQAIHTAMSSARTSARSFAVEADDMVSGVKLQDLGKSIRQYDPIGLTVFDLVLLALVVHQLSPIYSLFESQCYWFANIIFDVIVAIYPSKSQCRPDTGDGPRILFPPDYLPQEFGQFMGVTINDPRVVDAVVSVAKSHFEEAKKSYQKKVIFYYFRVTVC